MAVMMLMTSVARAEMWTIMSDEWPPYSCAKCPDGGAGIKALKEALKSVNVDVEVTYLSWVHVMRESKSQKYTGYLAWQNSLRKGYVLPSRYIFLNHLVLVEQKSHPLQWNQLSDLKGKRIGLHEGSGYYEEFMGLVRKKVIIGEIYPSDTARVLLVSQGKLDGALMDRDNARFYLSQMQAKDREKVQINEKVLKSQGTFVAIQEKQKDKLSILDEALRKVDTQKIVDDYLKENFKP